MELLGAQSMRSPRSSDSLGVPALILPALCLALLSACKQPMLEAEPVIHPPFHKLWEIDPTEGCDKIGSSIQDRVVDGSILYLTTDCMFARLDLGTGHETWRQSLPRATYRASRLALDAGTLFVSVNDHELLAVDAATGSKRWSLTRKATNHRSSQRTAWCMQNLPMAPSPHSMDEAAGRSGARSSTRHPPKLQRTSASMAYPCSPSAQATS